MDLYRNFFFIFYHSTKIYKTQTNKLTHSTKNYTHFSYKQSLSMSLLKSYIYLLHKKTLIYTKASLHSVGLKPYAMK